MKKKNFNLKSFLISVLRKNSYRVPMRQEALNNAKVSRGVFLCNICKKEFKRNEVCIDHINPVIDLKKGFTNWDDYINRLYCDSKGLQVLCYSCHDKKTELEKKTRKKYNNKRKRAKK